MNLDLLVAAYSQLSAHNLTHNLTDIIDHSATGNNTIVRLPESDATVFNANPFMKVPVEETQLVNIGRPERNRSKNKSAKKARRRNRK